MCLIIMKRGFTLAEVLITLAIIGVIAAMVIPSLKQSIDEAQYKAAWKTSYSTIYQAYMNLKRERGGSLAEYFGAPNKPSNMLTPYINQLKTVTRASNFPSNGQLEYKTLSGADLSYYNIGYAPGTTLVNGMHLYFRSQGPDHFLVWVDVNGYFKGPNVLGKDLFGATITKDWMKPIGAPDTNPNANCSTTPVSCSGYGFHTSSSCTGAGCSAEYLYK